MRGRIGTTMPAGTSLSSASSARSARSRDSANSSSTYGRDLGEAERDDLAALLELGEEEDVVDELRHLDDLGARLVDQLLHVDARQLRGVEQREQARERRPQLVRDRRREPDAQALVAARQVLRGHAITRSGR